jgi:hypothetical protein
MTIVANPHRFTYLDPAQDLSALASNARTVGRNSGGAAFSQAIDLGEHLSADPRCFGLQNWVALDIACAVPDTTKLGSSMLRDSREKKKDR